MDEKLRNAAINGDLLNFVEKARNNEIESGISDFLSQTSYDKENILHLAIRYRQNDFIEKVLKGGELLPRAVTDQLIKQQDIDGYTPLHVAVWVGNIDIFKLVLEYDHNQAEVKNGDGNTPLHVAVPKFRDEIATLLLEQHPGLARAFNKLNETPLHLAIEQYRQIINLPIMEREKVGSTYLGMIKLMIEKESCVACWQDATGATPLHRAAPITSTYTLQVIRLILNHCPKSVEVRDNSSKTILHLLKTIPSYKEAKDLLDIPELFGLINHQDKDGNTPLHWAAMNLNHNMVRVLLDSSAKQSIRRNNDGITAAALIQEQFEVIMEKKQMTMEICKAIERVDITFLKERLDQFGLIFLFPRDSNGRNVLHKLMQINSRTAILHNDFVAFIQQLLESFPELIVQVDHNGDTPLHILMQNSPDTMIRFASESYNYEVLSLSKSTLVLKLIDLFSWYFNRAQEEASVKGGRYDPPWLVQNVAGNTPLHEALRVNYGTQVVIKLIELDIAITAKLMNDLNETPLHLFAGYDDELVNMDYMENVIEPMAQANIEAAYTCDKNGLTPLLRAAQQCNFYTISSLYEHFPGAASLRDGKQGQTFWHLLVKHPSYATWFILCNHPHLRDVLKFGDNEANTPLHLAIQGRRFDLAIMFLEDMDTDLMKMLLKRTNNVGIAPKDLITSSKEIPVELDHIINKGPEITCYRSVYGVAADDMKDYMNTIGVVAALLMTVTFTAAFSVPGGLIQEIDNKKTKGTPILVNDAAFQVFMFFDILTMSLSTVVLFCLLWILAADRKHNSLKLLDSCIFLLSISFNTTLWTFAAAVYATTIHVKPWITIYTLAICPLLTLLMQKYMAVHYVGPIGPFLKYMAVNYVEPIVLFFSFYKKKFQQILESCALVVGIRSVWYVPTSQIEQYTNTMGIVAVLITTITFTAAFTVPGGNVEGNKGFPVLIREAAFQAFMISNILAMFLSTMVLFCLLWVIATIDKSKSVVLIDFSLLLLLLSLYATLVSFMMGVYATTIHSKPWIAITTLVLCSLLLLLLMLLTHKKLGMGRCQTLFGLRQGRCIFYWSLLGLNSFSKFSSARNIIGQQAAL